MLPATPSLVAKRNPLMPRQPVPLEKAYRLINHGPTVMISAQHGGITNVMSASWLCALDYAPARVTVVIDKENYTRHLIEQSGWFGVQIPFAAQAETVITMGESRKDNPDKLRAVSLFTPEGYDVPLVADSAAWLICRVLPEPHNQETYDLFIGEVAAAWADDRVFRNGHWHFDDVGDDLKTLHYIAGGQFYRTGCGLKTDGGA